MAMIEVTVLSQILSLLDIFQGMLILLNVDGRV